VHITAVICEYNPFHNGHLYLNSQIKQAAAANTIAEQNTAVVAIMSGNFVQRGGIAIASKFARARAALQNGADIVIELPTVFAVSCAEVYARAGVAIADALGCVNSLAFGSECGDIDDLLQTVQAVDLPQVQQEVAKQMADGCYYPKALQAAVDTHCGEKYASLLGSPNNVLGLEYCKALQNAATQITPVTFKRVGVEHHSTKAMGNIASASYIRQLLAEQTTELNPFEFVPQNTIELLANTADFKKLQAPLLYKLRTMGLSELAALPDVTEGLENRIAQAIRTSSNVDEILEKVKTKRYTMARLRRILVCALLGITAQMQAEDVQYIRVLGFNKTGEKVLAELKHTARLPVVTNVADGYAALPQKAKELFDIDIKATDVFGLAAEKSMSCGLDFTQQIIKV
jgi:predicted nucleotidyltransferase